MKFKILQMDKLQHIIEQKQELLIRKSVSLLTLDYSDDMTAEEQKRYINHLVNCVNDANLESCAMKLVLQDFLDKQKADAKRLTKLDDILSRVESLKSSLEKRKLYLKKIPTKTVIRMILTESPLPCPKNSIANKKSHVRKLCSSRKNSRLVQSPKLSSYIKTESNIIF